MSSLKYITLLPLLWILPGPACSESDPATILAEQTQRRHQEEITQLSREQHFNRSQFERKLDRVGRKASGVNGATGHIEQRGLRQRLTEIQQQEAQNLTRREQSLNNLELDIPSDDFRQRQELNRLRHRQRADAFIDRQNLRLRRSQLDARRRR